MGGLIAKQMGLPVKKFIISTNENDEVPEFLKSGIYKSITPSKNCISSAMNVGHPSNLSRIVALYGGMMDEMGVILREPDMKRMRQDLFGVRVTDNETRVTISEAFKNYGIVLEPHGAVAWRGIVEYFNSNKTDDARMVLSVSLETAHPAKFPEELRRIINVEPPLPYSLSQIDNKTENFVKLENNYEILRSFIIKYI
jgi:threonine synthase